MVSRPYVSMSRSRLGLVELGGTSRLGLVSNKISNVSVSHCEQCVLGPSKLKKQCDICDCAVQYKLWNDHRQTKKHRLRIYVEQPADEYQGEYDKCMACDSSFQQSDLLKEHICVKCTINRNIPKMHCDICNSDMLITNWFKHLNSRKHLNNASR
jgi:hypothetical protein